MANHHDLMAVMARHIGRSKGISCAQLARELSLQQRYVRSLISSAREEGIAICGHPSTGYYVAETEAEITETLDFLKHRALHSLRLYSRLAKIPLPDLIGQLHLPT